MSSERQKARFMAGIIGEKAQSIASESDSEEVDADVDNVSHEDTYTENVDYLRDHVDWLLEGWKQALPDLPVAPIAIINRIERLTAFLRPEIADVYEQFGLTGPTFAVIATLRRAGKPYQLSQRALMDALQLTSGTMSVRIDRMVREQFVERLPDPNDQRGVLVCLTEKGLALFERVAPIHLANEDRLLSALNSEQREQLAALLRTLLLSFEPIAPEDPQHPSHWLGASLAPAHVARKIRRAAGLPDIPGLLVQSVAVPGPASQAGLQEGDLIIKANDAEIRSIAALHEQLPVARDEVLTLTIVRGVELQTLQMHVEKP